MYQYQSTLIPVVYCTGRSILSSRIRAQDLLYICTAVQRYRYYSTDLRTTVFYIIDTFSTGSISGTGTGTGTGIYIDLYRIPVLYRYNTCRIQ